MAQNEKHNSPLPLFDSIEFIKAQKPPSHLKHLAKKDFFITKKFLESYSGRTGTFNSYRRETERLLHWCNHIANKSLKQLKPEDIESFVLFCQNPSASWIGTSMVQKFLTKKAVRIPNEQWRPFVATISKFEAKKGEKVKIDDYELSQGAIKELFAILSSFYNYLLQEEYAKINPVALIKQKSKFIRKSHGKTKIRRLSTTQWQYVIKVAETLANKNPKQHERTLFIMSALYSMYLRISELCDSERWTPLMSDFKSDNNNKWWFTTVGKGNKERDIAVSNSMLESLKRWRNYLGLSPLPPPSDNSPLLPKTKGKGAMKSITQIRIIVQKCFDKAAEELKKNNLHEEADSLESATVHWLRHTGISDDVKHRPREHVRDDAGHSSSATTDKYIDIDLQERHKSAESKTI